MVPPPRTGGRVVDGTALEMRRPFTGFVGSNPTLSASFKLASALIAGILFACVSD